MRIDSLPPLREVIARHDLRAKKAFGQNFLMDLNLTRRIARAAGPLDGFTIYEVGPGPGGLTRALLLEGARDVVVVERDPRVKPALEEIASKADGYLHVHMDDAMAVDEKQLIGQKPAKIVSNLPYNVGTALFIRWMTCDPWPPWWHSMTLMFQKEVAERIVAQPDTKAYGRLAVLAQWRAQAKILFNLPARAFTPPPKVDSAVIQITPNAPLDAGLRQNVLEKLVEAAFSQRRKMLRTSLKKVLEAPELLLKKADIDPTRRAESVSVADFCRLARLWQDML